MTTPEFNEPEVKGPEFKGPKPTGPEPTGAGQTAPELAGRGSAGSEFTGAGHLAPEIAGRGSAAAESAASESVRPQPSVRDLIAAPHPDYAPLPPSAPAAPGVRETRGVPYAEIDGGRPLELDLWRPEGDETGPLPLVLYVHGGAWRRGRRDDLGMRTRHWKPRPFARIAAEGFAVACVDYRLSGEATFPAPLDDLRAALRWLALRSAELGVDTARTVVWGESAGGHLASLLALTHTDPALAGAVIWYGPSDLTRPRGGFTPENPETPEARMLGAAPAAAPERAREASPVAQVRPVAPPFLLVHGEQDTMVDCSHSRSLAAALEQAGADAELWTVDGADHGWHHLPDDRVEEIFTRSLAFAARRVT
ncbi:alpha/beta hydrolase [Streptomyces sp. 15-116A]|uniref:alpha/beta hydrolase n=1 Tax=Streptomyces sp. 15-116A TaxID=2259035 RepID=UPI0021B3FF68|nr:alpha/beta hydrolase [Streptomyces sp. 15-116A]MCT7353053.1 alpha/beta hydrolase [Streptomyces sp. 15-116A]